MDIKRLLIERKQSLARHAWRDGKLRLDLKRIRRSRHVCKARLSNML
jgi:hypothetical protein